MKRKSQSILVVLLFPLVLAGCATNPATGRREFTPFMTPAQEAAIGAEQHPGLLAQFGGEYGDAALREYIARVGSELAARSELSDLDFTFTLLDSEVVNAFALPGGYVYMSRSLLALFNDEAELASVLGHEIGHVTARHAANRYNRSVFAGLGTAILGQVTGSSTLANVMGQGSQLYLLSYSRGQESQSDELGQRYMTRTGYDPIAAVNMLEALARHGDLDAQINGTSPGQIPNWARTHPEPRARARAALERVSAMDPGMRASGRQRDRFLNMIDGMMFGDDPAKGLVRDQLFLHPAMDFRFEAPQGFTLVNTADAVIGVRGDEARFFLTGGPISASRSTLDFMTSEWRRIAGDEAPDLRTPATIPGAALDILTATTVLTDDRGSLNVRVVAVRLRPDQAFLFTFVMVPSTHVAHEQPLVNMARAMRPMTRAEHDEAKARRIRVVTVQHSDTASALSRKMPFGQFNLDWFLLLNGLDASAPLQAGERVKIVVER